MEKLNLTQEKHTFTKPIKRNVRYYNTKKLKPGLVACYDIQPGKRTGLILVLAIHKSVTHLLRHLPTYLQPRDPYGAITMNLSINSLMLIVKNIILLTVTNYFDSSTVHFQIASRVCRVLNFTSRPYVLQMCFTEGCLIKWDKAIKHLYHKNFWMPQHQMSILSYFTQSSMHDDWHVCLQCFDIVGWASGRASGL